MQIAIIGAGFTGLSAALTLVRSGQTVEVFDASDRVGGLAVGFRQPGWDWTVERFYHHIFTNDDTIISLATELGLPPLFSRPVTAVLWENKRYQFDSPFDLLRFPGLPMVDKLRMGMVLAGFKLLPNGRFLERWTTSAGLEALLGAEGYQTIWEPLLTGKFNQFAPDVNLAWFWARIKKRTPKLGTFPGGFQALADRMADTITSLGGVIHLNTRVEPNHLQAQHYEAVLSTLPSRTGKIQYLDAHVLFLELVEPFLHNVYWLNILDRQFPFLVTAEHTNFVDPSHFENSHLLYIGNYLPRNHRLFKLSTQEVLNEFFPWLVKINPRFSRRQIKKAYVFHGPFAQPVVTVNYSRLIPSVRQSDKQFIANQAMIYPWDRGTNYAVELGQKAARTVLEHKK